MTESVDPDNFKTLPKSCPDCGCVEYLQNTAEERMGICRCKKCGLFYTRTTMERVVAQAPLEKEIRAECAALAEFLVGKNRAYGNSAANPCRIFAKRTDPLAQIDVRIDDKLNRLMNGTEYPGDNDVLDLAGYLVLRMIVDKKQKEEA